MEKDEGNQSLALGACGVPPKKWTHQKDSIKSYWRCVYDEEISAQKEV
jgi:hypothetical protein